MNGVKMERGQASRCVEWGSHRRHSPGLNGTFRANDSQLHVEILSKSRTGLPKEKTSKFSK